MPDVGDSPDVVRVLGLDEGSGHDGDMQLREV